MILILVALNQ